MHQEKRARTSVCGRMRESRATAVLQSDAPQSFLRRGTRCGACLVAACVVGTTQVVLGGKTSMVDQDVVDAGHQQRGGGESCARCPVGCSAKTMDIPNQPAEGVVVVSAKRCHPNWE